MQRREFVKNALCISCMGVFASGCGDIFSNMPSDFDYKKSRFYYKTEDELPKKIRLDICSLCQLRCPECPIARIKKKSWKYKLGFLNFQDFKKFIDKHSFIEEIELSNRGEIFLNPDFDKIIKYAHEKNIKLYAHGGVNLNTVEEKTLENLVKYQFRLLKISIDGATAETYKIYRRGGDFNTVINNIKRINSYKEKYNNKYPELIYQFILFGHNEHEIEKAKKLAKELKMEIVFKKNWAPKYSPLKNKKLLEQLVLQEKFTQYGSIGACNQLFSSPQIDFDGELLGCCRITKNPFGANAFKQGLLKCLNSPNFIYTKYVLTDFNTIKKQASPCYECDTYKKIKETNSPILV